MSTTATIPGVRAAKVLPYDEAQMRAFLAHTLDPAVGCMEMRILEVQFQNGNMIGPADRYVFTIAGYYNNANSLVADAKRVRDANVYVTANPIKSDLLARSYNKLAKAKSTANDENVARLLNLYIDVDAKRPAWISATDAELAAAEARRDAILGDFPELAAASVYGRSGNGGFILARLVGYPNDEEGRSLIARVTDGLDGRYSDDVAKIDTATKNPSRVMPLIGTMKCKGSNIPERSWRMAILQSPEGEREIEPLDLRSILDKFPAAAPTVIPMSTATAGEPKGKAKDRAERAFVVERARKCIMAWKKDSVEGEKGHATLHAAARCLIDEFALTRDEALPVFREFNQQKAFPPEDEKQLTHKIDDAIKKFPVPSRRLVDAPRPGSKPSKNGRADAPPLDIAHIRAAVKEVKTTEDLQRLYLNDSGICAELARAEDECPAQFEAIVLDLAGVKGFTKSALKRAMAEHKPEPEPEGEEEEAEAGAAPHDEYHLTDDGNAKRLIQKHGENIHFCKPRGSWLVWNEVRWGIDDSLTVERMAKDVPGEILRDFPPTLSKEVKQQFMEAYLYAQSRKAQDDLMKMARSEPGIPVLPAQLDADPWSLNCLNGTIDLRTGELRPHRKADLITKLCPVVYDPEAKAPRWEQFEREIFADDESVIAYMRRAVGYAMTADDSVQEINILYGGGSNGKNVYLDTVKYIMGDYACTADPSLLLSSWAEAHPTGVADLCGRRLVTASETEDGRQMAEAMVKRLTGDRVIKARFMHQNFFEFERTFKVFLATNYKPEIKGTNYAIWRRIRLVPFQVQFVKEGDPQAPPIDPPKVMREVKGLDKVLMAEAPGILALLVKACLDWRTNGMRPPEAVIAATDEYRKEMDQVAEFIGECCDTFLDHTELRTKARTKIDELNDAYARWAERNRVKDPLTPRKLGGELETRGYKLLKSNGRSYRTGITIKASAEEAGNGTKGTTEDTSWDFSGM